MSTEDNLKFNNTWTGLLFIAVFTFLAIGSNAQNSNIYTESAWTERDKWQKAELIIEQLSLEPGDKVADLGCHEGYMTIKLSRQVESQGLVYAVDIGTYKLKKLREHLSERNIENVIVTEGEPDDPKLPKEQLDAVLILDAYHEMDDHMLVLEHIKSALKSGGRLVIVEPIRESLRGKGRSEQEGKHEIDQRFVKEDLEKAGYRVIKEQDPFIDRTKPKGDKLWLLVAVKDQI